MGLPHTPARRGRECDHEAENHHPNHTQWLSTRAALHDEILLGVGRGGADCFRYARLLGAHQSVQIER